LEFSLSKPPKIFPALLLSSLYLLYFLLPIKRIGTAGMLPGDMPTQLPTSGKALPTNPTVISPLTHQPINLGNIPHDLIQQLQAIKLEKHLHPIFPSYGIVVLLVFELDPVGEPTLLLSFIIGFELHFSCEELVVFVEFPDELVAGWL
jgi:hypothetical protein